MLRKNLFIIIALLCSLMTFAQDKQKFDPVKFEAELEQYVIKEAGITQAEQKKFLPVFREMRKKQIALMESSRKGIGRTPASEKDWELAIKTHDENEIKMKQLLQNYHNQLLKIIPASKLMKVVKAEERFHREQFRQFAGHDRGNGHHGQGRGQENHRKK